MTLTEIVLSISIATSIATVAGNTLISQLKVNQKIEATERQQNDWARANSFIESEIVLSQRLTTDIDLVSIPEECNIKSEEFRLAINLGLTSNLPPVIYSLKTSEETWLPNNTLWRCGPGINSDGTYNVNVEEEPFLDGLTDESTNGGFTVTTSSDGKYASFTLALKGHSTGVYSKTSGSKSRINPLYIKPNSGSLCLVSSAVSKIKGTKDPDDINKELSNKDELICGEGPSNTCANGDVILGGSGNDIIEAGNGSSTIKGNAGDDTLQGTLCADSIDGGNGDDTLIGLAGSDTLVGGNGRNSYLPGTGDDTVTGGEDVDIVFFEKDFKEYNLSSNCTTSSCTISNSVTGENKLTGVEIVIFRSYRLDLR